MSSGTKGRVKHSDDFLGDVVTDPDSSATENSGSAAVDAGAASGVLRLTTGAADGNRTSWTHGLNWQANDGGPLQFETRIKSVTAITARAYFVGFTDTLAATTLENPIEQSGTTITSTATNAVGFMYDTASTNDTWHLVAVNADTDSAAVNTGLAPAAAGTWQTLNVQVDTDGDAVFTIDGVEVGRIANSVAVATSLTPIVHIETRSAAAVSVDVDYVELEGGRQP